MKKVLLSLLVISAGYFASAQDYVQVLSPAALEASYAHRFVDTTDWTAAPDMTNPANRVVAPVVIARDATTDSLMCNATTMDLTGKIALIYRGQCNFTQKIINAQNAGAVGVIVSNNVMDTLFGMAGGAAADPVTIPAASIKKNDALILSGALHDGVSVTMLLGNKDGYYANDLGSVAGYMANVPAQVPAQLAANTTDFPIKFAILAINKGTATATNVKVGATIIKNGTELYTDTSSIIPSLNPGDSTDSFTFTDYSGNLGAGDYLISYNILSDATDEFKADNEYEIPFRINNEKSFSYAMYDTTSHYTSANNYIMPSPRSGEFVSCLTFRSPKASQMAINGFGFTFVGQDAQGNAVSLQGEEAILSLQKWNDVFTYGTDNPTFNNLVDVTSGSYIYPSDLSGQFVHGALDQQVVLEDNTKYLACVTTFNTDIFIGYDDQVRYNYYQALEEMYVMPFRNGPTDWGVGFKSGVYPSLTLDMIDASEVATKDIQSTTSAKIYPNPATDVVNVAIDNFVGNATLTVTDLSGRTIVSSNVNVPSNGIVSFNSSNLKSGMYIVKMELANGNQVKSSLVIE